MASWCDCSIIISYDRYYYYIQWYCNFAVFYKRTMFPLNWDGWRFSCDLDGRSKRCGSCFNKIPRMISSVAAWLLLFVHIASKKCRQCWCRVIRRWLRWHSTAVGHSFRIDLFLISILDTWHFQLKASSDFFCVTLYYVLGYGQINL